MSTSSTHVGIPDAVVPYGNQHTQYGMKYPDGSVKWSSTTDSYRGTTSFEGLAKGHEEDVRTWKKTTDSLADGARIDRDVYRGMFKPIKRTIVVAVTAAEDA